MRVVPSLACRKSKPRSIVSSPSPPEMVSPYITGRPNWSSLTRSASP
jgi:hypothetical protein